MLDLNKIRSLAAALIEAIGQPEDNGIVYTAGLSEPDEKGLVRLEYFDKIVMRDYGDRLNWLAENVPAEGHPDGFYPGPLFYLDETTRVFAGRLTQAQFDRIKVNASSAGFNQNRAVNLPQYDGNTDQIMGANALYGTFPEALAQLDALVKRRLRDVPPNAGVDFGPV